MRTVVIRQDVYEADGSRATSGAFEEAKGLDQAYEAGVLSARCLDGPRHRTAAHSSGENATWAWVEAEPASHRGRSPSAPMSRALSEL